LEFFVFSLVDVVERRAYPVAVGQTIRSEAEKAAGRQRRKKKRTRKTTKNKKAVGRKQGSVNKDKNALDLSPELERINKLLAGVLKLLRVFVKVKYLALDGHFGHHQAVLMALENDLHLISKMRRDAALFEKYEGGYGGRGARRKYGKRLKYDLLPTKYLRHSERAGEIITNYYQGLFLHREFGREINVVIIVKVNVKTKKTGHAILFSSDVEMSWEKMVDYYSLRFQIEFNFRDAKQHFGLEDFMTRGETGVENAANLSFLMVNVSAKLIAESGEKCVSINDLKTRYRGEKYLTEAIKTLLGKPETKIKKEAIEEAKEKISQLGRIHQRKEVASTA
jgi:putative transposase